MQIFAEVFGENLRLFLFVIFSVENFFLFFIVNYCIFKINRIYLSQIIDVEII
jgi:hypothetical protein